MKTLFFDVDTQYDFLEPAGKLYMPGAENIVDSVSNVRRLALDHGFSIIASQDWHTMNNPEISLTPDNKLTFPPHCISDSDGARRIGYLGNLPIEYLDPSVTLGKDRLQELISSPQFHIVLRKNNIDVFTNPNAIPLLDLIDPEVIIVYGVALDVCIELDLNRLLELTRAALYLLTDVTKSLRIKPDAELYHDFTSKGINLITIPKLPDLISELQTAS